MTDSYHVRVLLVRLRDGAPTLTRQNSTVYHDEAGALALYRDLVRLMPNQPMEKHETVNGCSQLRPATEDL